MKKLFLLILAASILTLSGCDVTKRIFKKKEISKTHTEVESTTSRLQELNENWSLNQGNLLHRDSQLTIRLDSISQIDLTPSGVRVIGFNPVIHGQILTTQKDSIIATGSAELFIKDDSTGTKTQKEEKETVNVNREKHQKTQKLAPIIVLSILLIIALLYLASRFKLI